MIFLPIIDVGKHAASLTLDDFETVSIAAMALWVGLPGVLSYIYYWKKYHGRL